jgi:hypothetical protein
MDHEITNLKEEVKISTKGAAMRLDIHTAIQVAPSLGHRQQPERGVGQVVPPEGRRRKLNADEFKTQEKNGSE